jgi:hypothetical protein
VERAPVVLAALGPKMLELARDRTFGAHPYFSPPAHTAFARSVLGPEPLLVPEQAVSLVGGTEGLAAGRAYARNYLQLPNYVNNLRRFGFGDDDFRGGGSDELTAAIIPYGPALVHTRVREHLAAGADHVLLQLIAEDGRFAAGQLDELASLLADLLRRTRRLATSERSTRSAMPADLRTDTAQLRFQRDQASRWHCGLCRLTRPVRGWSCRWPRRRRPTGRLPRQLARLGRRHR